MSETRYEPCWPRPCCSVRELYTPEQFDVMKRCRHNRWARKRPYAVTWEQSLRWMSGTLITDVPADLRIIALDVRLPARGISQAGRRPRRSSKGVCAGSLSFRYRRAVASALGNEVSVRNRTLLCARGLIL